MNFRLTNIVTDLLSQLSRSDTLLPPGHGFAHRDIIHPDGDVEKIPLAMGDYNAALTFAELDIRSNWKIYRERFIEEVKKK